MGLEQQGHHRDERECDRGCEPSLGCEQCQWLVTVESYAVVPVSWLQCLRG